MLVVILALAACGKGKPSRADCERYADHVANLTAQGYQPDQVEAIRKRVHNVSIDVCNAGTINADQLECSMKAETTDAMHACQGAKTAAEPAPPPPPPKPAGSSIDDRAAAGNAHFKAILVAFDQAIGSSRCDKTEALQAAIDANADHIKGARAAFADPAVQEAMLANMDPETKAAFNKWRDSQIDGTCKVTIDIDTINSLASSK